MKLRDQGVARTAACLFILLLLATGLFAYTVELRKPWFNVSGKDRDMQFLTNELRIARNWYREGAWHLRFGLYTAPDSIENPPSCRRGGCVSYPPGSIIPVYLVSKLRSHEATLALMMAYNLFNQLLVALVLSFMTFAFLRQIKYARIPATLFAVIPLLIELLTPSPLFQFQMRFLMDHMVLIWCALYIFIEVLRDGVTDRRARFVLGLAQAGVAFSGILTDYVFGLFAGCVYLKRLFRGEFSRVSGFGFRVSSPKPFLRFLGRSVLFWLPVALGLFTFVVQLFLLNELTDVFYKGSLWGITGKGLPLFSLKNYFWKVHMVKGYGNLGVALLWLSLACILVAGVVAGAHGWLSRRAAYRGTPLSMELHPSMAPALALAFMLTVPCFLHAFLLRNHAAFPVHTFSALKFSIPLAVVPFILAPILVFSLLDCAYRVSGIGFRARNPKPETRNPSLRTRSSAPLRQTLFAVIMLALAVLYVHAEFPRVLPQFRGEVENAPVRAAAEFVGAHTTWRDVVFTFDPALEIPLDWPRTVFSMKSIYPALSLQLMYDQLAPVDGEYVVNILMHANAPLRGTNCEDLIPLAYHEDDAHGLRLLKIHKQDFLAQCKKAHVFAPPSIPDIANKPRVRGLPRYMPVNQDIVREMGEMTVDIDDE